jgi:4-alpha-glucanotransferase
LSVIAEDLGVIGKDVEALLVETGFRGMRVLQFGFFGGEIHLPHNLTENLVAYTATHDNTTLLGWIFSLNDWERQQVLFYAGFEGDWTRGGPNCAINKAWIRLLYMSGASIVIFPIQDLLGYGPDTRTNTPGTVEGNWRFRIRSGVLSEIDAGFYKALADATGRLPKPQSEPTEEEPKEESGAAEDDGEVEAD